VRAVVIIFPGSNRERDVCAALARACGQEPLRIWHRDADLPSSDLIVLPGGFAYEDRVRAGAIAAHDRLMLAVREGAFGPIHLHVAAGTFFYNQRHLTLSATDADSEGGGVQADGDVDLSGATPRFTIALVGDGEGRVTATGEIARENGVLLAGWPQIQAISAMERLNALEQQNSSS